MKAIHFYPSSFLKLFSILFFAITAFSCETDEPAPATTPPPDSTPPRETPFSQIPEAFVGTWYADHNEGPLTTNWEKGTFQGEQGFREFRTLVFVQGGKNAVEYTSEVVNAGDEVKQYLYKLTGTVEYKTNPASLTFYAQTREMRIFNNKYSGYKSYEIVQSDVDAYTTILVNPQATTFTSSTNYLNAKLQDGANQITVKYIKAGGSTSPPGNGSQNPGDPYITPPASGTHVKIGNQYYPTVTIGDREWMSINYAGDGGINLDTKPQYGIFIKYMDLKDIPVPAGWRIPTKQNYLNLLASQNIAFDEVWETTDGEDLNSKKRLGYLMASTGWSKQDGFANNKSGFNAVPANLQVTNGNPHGEGSNCLLWTSDLDNEGNPVIFKIIQLPSDTFASFGPSVIGFNPPHIPLRLVRDK